MPIGVASPLLLMGVCPALKWGVERERESVCVKGADMVEVEAAI